jgi:streptomycin 6-kinase
LSRRNDYLARWGLTLDGDPIAAGHSNSEVYPVRRDGAPAVLKIAHHPEEMRGGAIMRWWEGQGAAAVLAHDERAVMLERATGCRSLADMARSGEDDAATRILAEAARTLHGHAGRAPPSEVIRLRDWFAALWATADARRGLFAQSRAAADALFSQPEREVVLHGDIHHGNVLDFGARGWLAIDPKGVLGDHGYDYANTFCNPDGTTPERMRRQLPIVAEVSGLAPQRLLMWVLAYAGLSASWTLEDGGDPAPAIRIAEIAAAELGV